MYDINSIKLLKKTIFILSIWFVGITHVYSWGSLKTGEAFATHQYINEQAYLQLEQHPAFSYVDFPALEDIQNYASVRLNTKLGKYGLGPDVDGNSNFSEHWYNPKNKQGNAPKSAKKYHALLKEAMIIPRGTEYEKLSRKEKAKAAAYASHYIQDVTCPMHVTGMFGRNVDPDRVGGKKDISPFAGKYTPEQWKILVRRFKKAQNEADSKAETRGTMDYFDPLYFDANYNNYRSLLSDIGASELGSHFQFELQVELKYKADIASWDTKWKEVKEKGYIHQYYSNKASIDTLAKKVASDTYDAIGTEKNPGELWVDIGKENSAYEIPQFLQVTYPWFPKESNRDSIYHSIQVPYNSWWKAIQLTYVSWRSTFSALHISQNNIKFVKVPNKQDQYQLYVSVFNYEPESEAKGVEVEVGITGDIKLYLTSVKVPRSIPAGSGVGSGWLKVGNPLTITDRNTLNGKIELTITGMYDDKIPDSGKKVIEYDLKGMTFEALRMPDMIGSTKDDAKKILEDEPYNFKIDIESAGKSKSNKQADTVMSHIPEAGKLVANGENITLRIYDKDDLGNDCIDKALLKIKNIEKDISSIKALASTTVANCQSRKEVLDQLAKKIQIEKNIFIELKSQMNELMKKMDDTKKAKEALEKHDQEIDKLAKEIETILSELGEFSLKICQKSKSLNDHSISNAEHTKTAQWIQQNKKELKLYVESIKERHNRIGSYKKEIKKLIYNQNVVDTLELDNIKTKMNNMDNLSKEINDAVSEAKESLTDTLKSNSGLYSRKQDIRKSIDNLKQECGDELKTEIKALNDKLNAINLSKCTKDLGAKITNLKNSSSVIQKNISLLTEKMSKNKKQFTDYNNNVEKINSLNQNREITLLLVNNYVEKAKRFGTDGAICVVLSEETMKKVFIPTITGMKKDEALRILRNAGLTNLSPRKIGEAPSKMTETDVLTQRPETKKRVKKDTPIILTHYGYYISEAEKAESLKDELMSQKTCPTNTVKAWNSSLKKVDCICQGPTYVWDMWQTKCLTQKEAAIEHKNFQMDRSLCFMEYPGSVKRWNEAEKKVDCICEGPTMVWNKSRSACITQQEAALESAVCNYPNSKPVWNNNLKKAMCECLPNTFWNKNRSACLTQEQAALESAVCNYPNSKPVWNNNLKKAMCECLPRTFWNKNRSACITQEQAALENANCRNGQIAVLNYGVVKCQCPHGTTWVREMNRCANLNQVSLFCNQNFPGSVPQWDYKNNKQGCGCPKGTRAQSNRCVKVRQNVQEICGDGIDNNGNNQIDEGCNYNLQVILDDDECPDDTMALYVDGYNLGNNPAGHKRHYNVSGLSRGQHKIEVYGVKSGGKAYRDKKTGKSCANNDVITYSIEFGYGIKSKNGRKKSSSNIREGKSKSYTITVQ